MLPLSSGHHAFHYGPAFGHRDYSYHGDFFPSIHHEEYYAPHDHHEENYKAPSYSKGKGELSIRDFYEIALTALAFLAFGLFIIQLLMNVTVLWLVQRKMNNCSPNTARLHLRMASTCICTLS